ncbi:MAG TPA: TIGR01777 family oxidoreductase, partial [Longimicrobiales bacterium]
PGSGSRGIAWDPPNGQIDLESLEGHDGVVNLAGASIAALWTATRKRHIRTSRLEATTLLATALPKLRRPPSVLVSASAIGYYGDRAANEPLTEASRRGSGFLAETADAWEEATRPAADAGVRVALTRFGLVLSRQGGAFTIMLPVFKAGLGGRIGSGKQVWSWVAIDDVAGAIAFALENSGVQGPVNVVAPRPVTNLAFTRTLGRVLRRPTILGVPEFLVRAVGGQMAGELLLAGARVVPEKLQGAGFDFQYSELEVALRHLLFGSE